MANCGCSKPGNPAKEYIGNSNCWHIHYDHVKVSQDNERLDFIHNTDFEIKAFMEHYKDLQCKSYDAVAAKIDKYIKNDTLNVQHWKFDKDNKTVSVLVAYRFSEGRRGIQTITLENYKKSNVDKFKTSINEIHQDYITEFGDLYSKEFQESLDVVYKQLDSISSISQIKEDNKLAAEKAHKNRLTRGGNKLKELMAKVEKENKRYEEFKKDNKGNAKLINEENIKHKDYLRELSQQIQAGKEALKEHNSYAEEKIALDESDKEIIKTSTTELLKQLSDLANTYKILKKGGN